MTRFEILALLARIPHAADLKELCWRFGVEGSYRRSFREAMRTQLARLARYGLVSRVWERGARNARGNYGEFVYRITARGKARLTWKIGSAAINLREQKRSAPPPPA